MNDDFAAFSITLDRVADASPQQFAPAMETSLLDMLAILKPYPPQPARDRARTFNTYVRGIGHLPRSSFFTTGKGRQFRRVGPIRRTSEKLGQQWTSSVTVSGNTVTGVIENSASYAGVVQGLAQPSFHAETGWVTYEDAFKRAEEQIDRNFEAALDQLLNELAR